MNLTKIIFMLLACIMAFVAAISAEAADITFANIDLDHLDLVELYVSSANSEDWGENLIEGYTLSNNEDVQINVTDRSFDLRIIWEDGTEDTYNNLDNVPQNSLLLLGRDTILRQPQ